MGIGTQGHIGIGLESAWGTAVAATDYIESMNESLVTAIERFETRNIVGGIFEPDDEPGLRRHTGGIVAMVHPEAAGHVLKGVLGVSAVTSLHADLQENAFTAATVIANSLHPLPPYTLEVYRPGATNITSAFQFAGVNFSRLELAYAMNQDVRLTAEVIAKAATLITKTAPSFPGSPAAPFTFDTTSLQLGGAAVDRFEAVSITFDNQLQGIGTLNNTNEISRIRRSGPATTAIAGTVEFTDHTDYLSFLNTTEQQLVLSSFKATSFSLVVDIPRMIYTAYPVQIGGRDRLTVAFEGKGRYHTGSGNALTVTMTTINSY